jgi:Sec-independent protein translocase protein TatA
LNWVFYLLIALVVVLLWFVLSSVYRKVGTAFYKLYKKAKDEMADVEVIADDDIKDEVKNDDITENDNINEQNTYNTKTKETIE